MIIKAIISGERHIGGAVKRNLEHRNNCFELFGFDVLIDDKFRPWIMEINLSPSIACEAPLDFKIKSRLLSDTFNLAGIKQFNRKVECEKKIKSRTRAGLNHLTKRAQFSKLPTQLQAMRAPIAILGSGFLTKEDIECKDYREHKVAVSADIKKSILDLSTYDKSITQKDQEVLLRLATYKRREILREVLSEYQRKSNFERIFPAKGTDKYLNFFHNQNNLNKFVYEFIYDSIKREEEEKKVEVDPAATYNNFFDPESADLILRNKNKHFLDLEAKLRPLKQRPDSAVNLLKYKGLNTTDSNMSTNSTNKNTTDSVPVQERRKKRTTEDLLIDYFQGIIDNINHQFQFARDKERVVINFEQLEDCKYNNKPVITSLATSQGNNFDANMVGLRKRAKSSYGTSRRTAKPSFSYSSYLIQRFDNKTEQQILTTTLTTIIDNLKLLKSKTQRTNSDVIMNDASNDSFIGRNPIPVISRLKKSRYNGIPRPSRAMTAKYRPNVPKPRPTSMSNSSTALKYMPKSSKPELSGVLAASSSNSFVKPIVTKIESMTTESTKGKRLGYNNIAMSKLRGYKPLSAHPSARNSSNLSIQGLKSAMPQHIFKARASHY